MHRGRSPSPPPPPLASSPYRAASNVYDPSVGGVLRGRVDPEYARREVADVRLEDSMGSFKLEDTVDLDDYIEDVIDPIQQPSAASPLFTAAQQQQAAAAQQQQQQQPVWESNDPGIVYVMLEETITKQLQQHSHRSATAAANAAAAANNNQQPMMNNSQQQMNSSQQQMGGTAATTTQPPSTAGTAGSGTNTTTAGLSNKTNATTGGGGKEQLTPQQKREMVELTWERIRRWLWSHPTLAQRQAAAYIRGQNDTTVLHLICKLPNPPADILQALCEAAPDTAGWADTHGWLPLHHACANGASPEAIQILLEVYPAAKLQPDHQRRTPLHFYATRAADNPIYMAANAAQLADSGAAELRDGGGMLPMHYACAYGTHPGVLKVLSAAYPASLTAQENHGRTPMHLAMVNAHRDASPGVLRFLLSQPSSRTTVNARDRDGYLPLHLMALGLKGYRAVDPEKRENVADCLEMYLAAEPIAAADFLTAIQDLPDWLQDTAVVSKHVRNVLNNKIVQRFPTSILMLDGIFLILLIVSFAYTTTNQIDMRLGSADIPEEFHSYPWLVVLFIGASYFSIRELVQIASLISLGSLSQYFTDPTNWLDMTVIILTFYYAFLMAFDPTPTNDPTDDAFRAGVIFTQGILWVATIVYLKSTLVDFAVFVGGLFNVVQRLVAFLLAAGTVLLAFAQMFYYVYEDTEICSPDWSIPQATAPPEPAPPAEFIYYNPNLVECDFAHCTFASSLLKAYTMMMGQINGVTRYSTNFVAQLVFIAYAFVVVIILSNVLIAIVTDSYEIIQNDRAAIVFWSNRLDFVAEMDAIAYAVQRRLFLCESSESRMPDMILQASSHQQQQQRSEEAMAEGEHQASQQQLSVKKKISSTEYFREAWHQMMMLFDANLYDDVDWIETWVYNIFRIFCIFMVIPAWLTIGFCSAGWLWPPQVREYLFVQRETVASRSELERKKLEKLKTIQANLKALKQDMMREMENDRNEMLRMKAEVDTIQSEVLADLMQVRELLNSLILSP